MNKKRLSKDEYRELRRNIKSMQALYSTVFSQMTGRFPKNSKAIKSLLKTNEVLMSLDFDVEREFFNDFPNEGGFYVDHQ